MRWLISWDPSGDPHRAIAIEQDVDVAAAARLMQEPFMG